MSEGTGAPAGDVKLAGDDVKSGDDGKQSGANDQKQQQDGTDWKATSRTWEQRAKADKARADKAEADLEKARHASMTESEKAIEKARAEGRGEGEKAAKVSGAARLVGAEAKAALAGRGLDDARLDGLVEDAKGLTRLVGEDGEPDPKAISEWAERVAPKSGRKERVDLGQGARGASATRPGSMTEAIMAARRRS